MVALGSAIAFGLSLALVAATTLVGVFAIFHGHAHGAEMPDTASGFEYGAGFSLATGILHAIGIGLGPATGLLSQTSGRRIAQVGGGLMAVAGVAILAGFISLNPGCKSLKDSRVRGILPCLFARLASAVPSVRPEA